MNEERLECTSNFFWLSSITIMVFIIINQYYPFLSCVNLALLGILIGKGYNNIELFMNKQSAGNLRFLSSGYLRPQPPE